MKSMLASALLVGMGVAQASDPTWALRFEARGSWTGDQLQLVAAEQGTFAVSPTAYDGAVDLKVVARDARGRVVYELPVTDPRRLNAEVFDPVSGEIVHARTLTLPSGQFELRIPAHASVATVEIESVSGGKRPSKLVRYTRSDVERRVEATTRDMRAAKAASGTAMLHETGPTSNRFDIVLIGDGYTSAEQAKWQADARRVADGILADPLFGANRNAINIRRVDVVSAQSGVDDLTTGTYRNTALGMSIGCYNIERLVCADENLVRTNVASVAPADGRDVLVAVANSTKYGGSGGTVATLTMHTSAIELALHEIGHTAFQLADEYDYGTCAAGEPSEANVTRQTARGSIKWGDLIASSTALPTPTGRHPNGTVGLFTGARYCTSGVYRPTENSRMRTLGYPWHAVNERRANAVIARYYNGGGDPGGGAVTVNGTLSGANATANHPSPYHQSVSGGALSADLTGPANADFELLLMRWNGSAWAQVASSTGPTSTESIRYTASAGYYYLQVKSYSGSGAFTLKYTLPK